MAVEFQKYLQYYPGQNHLDFDKMYETIDENYTFTKEDFSKLRKTLEKEDIHIRAFLLWKKN